MLSGDSPDPRQHPFRSGSCPIQQVNLSRAGGDSLCLSAAGVCFLGLPSPAEELGLPCGWLTAGLVRPQAPSGFSRSAPLRCDRSRCLLYRGRSTGVHKSGLRVPDFFAGKKPRVPAGLPPCIVSACRFSHRARIFHFPMLVRDATSTKVHLRSPGLRGCSRCRSFPCLLPSWRRALGHVLFRLAQRGYRRCTGSWERVRTPTRSGSMPLTQQVRPRVALALVPDHELASFARRAFWGTVKRSVLLPPFRSEPSV